MPRLKKYNEQEVIEKAMNLFWKQGFENTSMQMLENEMGINKFSIYSSFGSKNGIFLESLNCYKKKLYQLLSSLRKNSSHIEDIKQYFYDFIAFSQEAGIKKGCLITNTAGEIREDADAQIKQTLKEFTEEVRTIFSNILKKDSNKSNEIVNQQADYLIISMFGLSMASRIFNPSQLDNYILNIFRNL
ncbi:TetR/AcrR family transcriptional regulator [Mangrovimonas sp. ST2L15]|uniref:TetR/AcrR family transcriptional regulator n=1 Tax=Mangrovimonas sp. ST2L15 TaxID=1645916 RepID=UPI0006B4EE2A|nr:TetR/AcrR family transcriptional regulator [Mangrovimonas sp. ST2L15]